MRVEILPAVEMDFDIITEYIARHNPTRAITFVEEIRNEFRSIGRNPEGYRSRPETGADVRLAPFGKYLILFRVRDEAVQIIRVIHGARNLKKVSF
jgi:toxin ParE1/3/4